MCRRGDKRTAAARSLLAGRCCSREQQDSRQPPGSADGLQLDGASRSPLSFVPSCHQTIVVNIRSLSRFQENPAQLVRPCCPDNDTAPSSFFASHLGCPACTNAENIFVVNFGVILSSRRDHRQSWWKCIEISRTQNSALCRQVHRHLGCVTEFVWGQEIAPLVLQRSVLQVSTHQFFVLTLRYAE
jgi:hypothetical protein